MVEDKRAGWKDAGKRHRHRQRASALDTNSLSSFVRRAIGAVQHEGKLAEGVTEAFLLDVKGDRSVPAGETPIQNMYSFWYIKRNSGNKAVAVRWGALCSKACAYL